MERPSIFIPVKGSHEEVQIFLDELPDDADDVLMILKAEQAPLDLWLTFAREYFKRGKVEQFKTMLEEGSSAEIDEYYKHVKYERLAILNALAAYYTSLGKAEANKRQKEEHYNRAIQCYNKASQIDNFEVSTFIGKGQMLLSRGDFISSLEFFKIGQGAAGDNVPGLLGEACIHFTQRNYREALRLYKKALEAHPQGPAVLRLGIALCHLMLKNHELARQAFQRVLQLDPENVEALVGLAMLDINSKDSLRVENALQLLLRAYEVHPYCSMALNHLANHFFYTGQHNLIEALCDVATVSTEVSQMKAESYYHVARSYHAKGDEETAFQNYRAAVRYAADDFVLPHYGLGQINLKRNALDDAIKDFERVLKVVPDNPEALKALAHIYEKQGKEDKALALFTRVVDKRPEDVQAWVELGELRVKSDFGGALKSFKRAAELLKKKKQRVPPELLNNIGALHYERNEFELAKKAYLDALGKGPWSPILGTLVVNTGALTSELPASKVTAVFNLGRLLERMHETSQAEGVYKLILKGFPKYVDCLLRLAAMAMARKDFEEAGKRVKEALSLDAKNVEALTLWASLETHRDQHDRAKETLRTILQNTGNKDPYAAIALGNWYLAAGLREAKDDRVEEAFRAKARELYLKALQGKANNMFAANGVGCVLANEGKFDQARETFSLVREASAAGTIEMPDVWVNLAHVYLAQGQFSNAIKTYEQCLKKHFNNTNVTILTAIARTHYDANQFKECKKVLLRAIRQAPTNYMLRFDVAITMQKFATTTLMQQGKRTAQDTRQSVAELKNAVRIFSQLLAKGNQPAHGFDRNKIESHIKYCKDTLDKGMKYVEAAEREEQQLKHMMDQAAAKAKKEAEARRLAEEAKNQEELDRKAELERRIREKEEAFQLLKMQFRDRSQKPREPDGDEGGGDEDAPEGGKPEKKRRKKEKGEKKEKKRRKKQQEEEDEEMPVEEPGGVSQEEEEYRESLQRGASESDEEEGRRAEPESEEDGGEPRKRRSSQGDESTKKRKRLRRAAATPKDDERRAEGLAGLKDEDEEEQGPGKKQAEDGTEGGNQDQDVEDDVDVVQARQRVVDSDSE